MIESEPKRRAEEFIKLRKELVLPPDDVNLGEELWLKRQTRILGEENTEFLSRVRKLLNDAPISEHFKKYLAFELKLEAATGVTRWDDNTQDAVLKDLYGISLNDNQYGIFDPKKTLDIEIKYFFMVLPLLRIKEEAGLDNGGVSWKEWGEDLVRRDRESK